MYDKAPEAEPIALNDIAPYQFQQHSFAEHKLISNR